MNYIFLNLKRFDIKPEDGGVNRLAPMGSWGSFVAGALVSGLSARKEDCRGLAFAAFFPEAHLIPAAGNLPPASLLSLGCQSVHHADTAVNGNFGAFTSLRTAKAARALGCEWTIIGHSEERRCKAELMALAGAGAEGIQGAMDELMNEEVHRAHEAGLKVLFCVGETADELDRREEVLQRQIEGGLRGADMAKVVLAYEPIWAIGPGKTPPPVEEIGRIASMIKALSPCPLVYGGGLKKENARAIGALPGLDGGLIALTRFSGEIGFYPEEYFEIVDEYMKGRASKGESHEGFI